MRLERLDHVVLTVRDVGATVAFYERALGMRSFTFDGGTRTALAFGRQKLNLHELGREHLPNAREARPGSADLCLLTDTPIEEMVEHLRTQGVEIELGPTAADGAQAALRSVYVRDPDGNLIEVANREGSAITAEIARDVMWAARHEHRVEHLGLTADASGAVARSVVVGLEEDAPVHLRYELRVDSDWRLRSVQLEDAVDGRDVALSIDENGTWRDGSGVPLTAFEGCREVDISVTPLTNTLPIRRLDLEVGRSADIAVVYVAVPALALTRVEQRYTRLAERTYRYSGFPDGFVADLEVDEHGLVIDYPGLFRRVWTR